MVSSSPVAQLNMKCRVLELKLELEPKAEAGGAKKKAAENGRRGD